jgi:hypothetical protein
MTAKPSRTFRRTALACLAWLSASSAAAQQECFTAFGTVQQACLEGRRPLGSSLGKAEKEYLRRACALNAAAVKVACEGQGGAPYLESACDHAVYYAKGLEALPSLSSFEAVRSMTKRTPRLAQQGRALLKLKGIPPARREKLVRKTHDGAVAWLARTCPDLLERLPAPNGSLVQRPATGEHVAPAAGSDRSAEAPQAGERPPPGESVALGASEDLPPEVPAQQIQEAVASKMEEFRRCLERQQPQNPDSHGTLKLHWVIGPDGDVSGVRQLSPEFEGQPIAQCLVGVVETIRFPRSHTRGQEVVFPFKF